MGTGLSATFILPYQQENSKSPKLSIAAFYTLANHALAPEDVPTEKSLPRYDVPVVLLAQLGVNVAHQRQGLGQITLVTALQHAYNIATNPNGIPSLGVILDVLDEEALAFYNSFEMFIPFKGQPNRLFLPMASIKPLLTDQA